MPSDRRRGRSKEATFRPQTKSAHLVTALRVTVNLSRPLKRLWCAPRHQSTLPAKECAPVKECAAQSDRPSPLRQGPGCAVRVPSGQPRPTDPPPLSSLARTYLPLRFLHACERDGEALGPVTLCYVTCCVTYYVRNVRNGNAVITLTPVTLFGYVRYVCSVT